MCYFENGLRRRPRVGPERETARQLAAQIHAQLETGAPSALGFEPITIPELQKRWLEHHEQVRRSSVHTIRRYRAATDHLLAFLREVKQVKDAAAFRVGDAEAFVCYHRAGTLAVPANLSLIALPPYSPELNPMENGWHYHRSHYWANQAYADYAALERRACQSWQAIHGNPELVRSIYHAPYLTAATL